MPSLRSTLEYSSNDTLKLWINQFWFIYFFPFVSLNVIPFDGMLNFFFLPQSQTLKKDLHFLSFALVHHAVARSGWLFVDLFLPHVIVSQMRGTQFNFSYTLRSIYILVIRPFEGIEACQKKNGRVISMSYILLQYESNTKRGASEPKHFPLSLSGNFTLGYV